MDTKDYTREITYVRADTLLPEEDVHAIVEGARLCGMSLPRFVALAAESVKQTKLVADAKHADDIDFTSSNEMLSAEDVEYEDDGTPICTEAQMCARFGQDWRELHDEPVDPMEIEREAARRADTAAVDPYAWVRDRYGRLV